MDTIQDRRDKKQVPGGLRLHQYANLYFHARNPMLFKRLNQAASLCVLRVSRTVLTLPKVVLADCNASSDYVRFLEPAQWRHLAFDDIYAMDWRHPGDPTAFYRHKSRKCAEALVPNSIPPSFVEGAYVVDQQAANSLRSAGFGLSIHINAVLFFRK